MSYRIDRRSFDDIVNDVTRRAESVAVPYLEGAVPGSSAMWSDALAGDELSAELLHELVRGHHSLLDHAALLPDRAARYWLESTCGIAALEPQAASAIVTAELADDQAPVLIEAGTELKGPKDRAGQATTFATDDQLVATGATLLGVRSHARLSDQDTQGDTVDVSFEPFAAPTAIHELYFCSDSLAFGGGTVRVHLDFAGVGVDVAELASLKWTYSGSEGPQDAVANARTAKRLVLNLDGGCSPLAVPTAEGDQSHCWVRVETEPGFDFGVLGFSFDSVTVTVFRRGLVPDSAWYNDGTVDVSREFKPFGDVPRRGDSFYVQSDESFSKRLNRFSVNLAPLNPTEYQFQLALLVPQSIQLLLQELALDSQVGDPGLRAAGPAGTPTTTPPEVTGGLIDGFGPAGTPTGFELVGNADPGVGSAGSSEPVELGVNLPPGAERAAGQASFQAFPDTLTPYFPFAPSTIEADIDWQVRTDSEWETLRTANQLANVTDLEPGLGDASEPVELGGIPGRFVRAFLKAGDFGWDAYQEQLVDFANSVAGSGAATTMPNQPTPPTLRTVSIDYDTRAQAPDLIVALNGHDRRTITNGTPFAHPVTSQIGSLPAGDVQVGLQLPDDALGLTLSVWIQVDSTASCNPSTTEDLSRWEVWTGVGWRAVAASDTSSFLRTSGLVRFVAPLDWAVGCSEAGATEGRWFRLATNQPERIGAIEAVFTDAVRAAAKPSSDGAVADLDVPEPEALKGPTTRIAGVKKLVNPLVGQPSRAAESDAAYLERAPQVTRTRNRLVQPADYELDIRARFPEAAFVAALPHFDGTDDIAPGHVGLVIIPESQDPAPLPSADLVARIEASIVDRAPIHATVAVHCPSYRRMSVDACIVLAPGVSALTARTQLVAEIDEWLHPSRRLASAIGRPIYRSELIVLLEGLDLVDRIQTIDIGSDDGTVGARGPTGLVERIDPPAPTRLGMVVSSGLHELELVEQLA